jgi:hypothetical protein
MRPRILHDVSQELAVRLQRAVEDEGERRIPVVLCHPLDPLESGKDLTANPVGILYPLRISPDDRLRQTGPRLPSPAPSSRVDRIGRHDLWLRVRYAFLVVGGSIEDQLEALAAALRALNDEPLLVVRPGPEPGGPLPLEPAAEPEDGAFPVRIVEESNAWRELGLSEHRLCIAFDVSVPIRSVATEEVGRILERGLELRSRREGEAP